MKTQIGAPALISPGDILPVIEVFPDKEISVIATLISYDDEAIIMTLPEKIIQKDGIGEVLFEDVITKPGLYRINIKIRYLIENGSDSVMESYYFSVINQNQIPRWNSIVAHPGDDGKLRYVSDYMGNRIPDYSTAGYKGGGIKIPDAPVRIKLEHKEGDDTQRIQEAIDYVSSLTPDTNGIRGAVLLAKGIFEIESSLEIRESGVVLRGEGSGNNNIWLDPKFNYELESFKNHVKTFNSTILIATGNTRRILINAEGENGPFINESLVAEITDQYVPVGAKSFKIDDSGNFNVGDKIIVQRTGNADWISDIGMDQIPQSPAEGSFPPVPWEPFNLNFENVITAIEGNVITLEGAILNAIEHKYGGGRIFKYSDEDRISNVGIENLRAISFWKPDEYGTDGTNHAHRFLRFNNTRDSWVQNLVMEHFYALGGAIYVSRTSKGITIRKSSNLIADPKYYSGPNYAKERTNLETGVEVGRYGFYSEGQSNLVIDCYTLNNRRSFGVGSRTPGPNVFLDCVAENSLTTSEPHHRWSVGGLYDNVKDDIAFINRLYHGTGQGWAGANYIAWNTRGRLNIHQPPTAQNWSIGHKGGRLKNLFPDYHFAGGYWEKEGAYVLPRSLYIQQLKDRKNGDIENTAIFNNIMLKERPDDVKIWNYPNPADFFTIFVYVMEQSSSVLLSVYSLSGTLISNVDLGFQRSGYHEVLWETTYDDGQPLNDGLYIYKFIINDHVYSNKFVINK